MQLGTRSRVTLAGGLALLLLLVVAFVGRDAPEAEADPIRLALDVADPPSWIGVLDPERATPGYTLTLFHRRIPMLLDLSGRIVHAWPDVRVYGRARLGRDGSLYLITPDDAIEAYDWEGRLRFRYALPEGHFPHHDVIRLASGSYLFPAREKGALGDYLLEVSPEGREVWRWNVADHREAFPSWPDDLLDASHVNSVHEIGPNPLFDAGDARFRPGNLLVSARNLDTVFVVDRETEAVVWQHREGLDYQHEALLVPSGWPGAGEIAWFNNRYHARDGGRGSRIEAIDPRTGERTFTWGSPFFFSSIAGSVQALPTGNFLVTSSRGARLFELTRAGEIVWQLETPYLPIRALRYAPDHCPQLARLEPPAPERVTRREPFVDWDLYGFWLPEQPSRRVEGYEPPTLAEARACRELRLPPAARLELEYGFHPALAENGGPVGPLDARFRVEVRAAGSDRRERVLDAPLRWTPGTGVQSTALALDAWAWREVELCLDARLVDPPPGVDADRALVWSRLQTRSQSNGAARAAAPETEADRRLREEQLRRMGYVQ